MEKIKKGSIVRLQTNAIHQESQKPLNGMHGSVYDSNIDGDYIVSVAELNGVQLPFSEEELVVVDNSSSLLC
jgi:hypothetical protein